MRAISMGAVALAMVVVLPGCVSLGGKAPDMLIMLTPDESAPAGPMAGGQADNAIVVLDPDADRRIDVDRVPVQINASSVAYLKDAVWVERPTRQFRRLLAETVRAKADRIVLEGTDFEVKGKTTVAGRLSQMGYDAVRQTVVVRYDAVVEDGGAVRTRRFEAEVPGIPASAAAVGPALNEAANTVAKEAAAWILGG
ncbi:MAG: membrane integrity-associated transporter subunit PqiC [Novosphingobium sp.]|nr:membrane integrity-associated transporter subunit PqiC [Novosphingobium sp.]